MAQKAFGTEEIDEMLDELDINIKRLRIEYEQFFLGNLKREPQVLKGKVQKAVVQMFSNPPRNARQKFRFNSLNARYQIYRQLWGRTMREMEQGTYKRDQFKAKVRQLAAEDERDEKRVSPQAAKDRSGAPVDQLYNALQAARQRTGEKSGMSQESLSRMVRKQVDAIRAKHGQDAKVKFKVVIEDNKAKVKATVSK